MKLEFCRQIFEKYSNIIFHLKTSIGSRVPWERTDMTKLNCRFSKCRKRVKKHTGWPRLPLDICRYDNCPPATRELLEVRRDFMLLERMSTFFRRLRKIAKMLLLPSLCLSLHASARNNSDPTGRIFMKFGFEHFSKIFRETSSLIKAWVLYVKTDIMVDHMSLNSSYYEKCFRQNF